MSVFAAMSIFISSAPIIQAEYDIEALPGGTVRTEWSFDKVSAAEVTDDDTGEPFVTEIPSSETRTYSMMGTYIGLELNCTGDSGAYVELAQPNGAYNIDRINLYQGSYVRFTAPEDGSLTIGGKAK